MNSGKPLRSLASAIAPRPPSLSFHGTIMRQVLTPANDTIPCLDGQHG